MTDARDLPLVERARSHGDRTAISATEGRFTYRELLDASARVAACLLEDASDLEEARVAFLVSSGFHYVAVQWGIWRAGGIAVPLGVTHPLPELEHVVEDSGAAILVAARSFEARARPLTETRGIRCVRAEDALNEDAAPNAERSLPALAENRRAMIVYTSGTTGRPKGVVTTHANIREQVTALISAWGWTADDHILSVLPLHHIHGIINVLTCALWVGARCEMLASFDVDETWNCIIERDLTLFMAVPTVYARLITAWEAAPEDRRRAMSLGCERMRLMVSGSAALPVPVLERWRTISGHVLLERYGMTEIGMALSNPLHGVRVPGYVGTPLPGVEVRLVDEKGNAVEAGSPGEIQVKGPGVFLEYWGQPDATRAAFRDGWFMTGDIAVLEEGNYRIIGRISVDIIKTGGYKVSALEIEEVLRAHPDIDDCAVVGVADPVLGERICVAAELRQSSGLTLDGLQAWAGERLAPYKIPRMLLSISALPRNAMGKVTKAHVKQLFET